MVFGPLRHQSVERLVVVGAVSSAGRGSSSEGGGGSVGTKEGGASSNEEGLVPGEVGSGDSDMTGGFESTSTENEDPKPPFSGMHKSP